MAHAEFARRVELLGQVRNDALVFAWMLVSAPSLPAWAMTFV